MRQPARGDVEGQPEAAFAHRADRFKMALPVRYRAMAEQAAGEAAEQAWHEGQIENLSSSGLLFRAAAPLAAATAIELMFSLPSSAARPPATVRCKAQVVRIVPPEPPDTRTALAVAIQHYRLARGAATEPENQSNPGAGGLREPAASTVTSVRQHE